MVDFPCLSAYAGQTGTCSKWQKWLKINKDSLDISILSNRITKTVENQFFL